MNETFDVTQLDAGDLANLYTTVANEMLARFPQNGARAETDAKEMTPNVGHRPPNPPTLNADVMYRSRTDDYWLAAKVSRTCRSSSPEALHRAETAAGLLFMEPLKLYEVDLTVFSPGGCYVDGQPNKWTGTYAEHHITYDPEGAPGTWCWYGDLISRGVMV